MLQHVICLLLLLLNVTPNVESSWDEWWTYDGISGPNFWGLLNPEWGLCTKGRRQSPINIVPEQLLFDSNLRSINIDRHRISGTIENNGHSIVLKVDNHPNPSANGHANGNGGQQQLGSASALNGQLKSADFFSAALAEQSANALLDLQGSSMGLSDPLQFGASIGDNLHSLTLNSAGNSLTGAGHLALQPASQPTDNLLNIWGGPLSYVYTLDSLHLHFGRSDNIGSEHQIGGVQFPAELQCIAYNSDLYQNVTEASSKSNGLTAISLLLHIGNNSNSELETLINLAQNIKHRGENVTIKSFSLYDLIPDLTSYLTYEGSLTIPGCYETVTWIIINKPVFITRQQLFTLRKLMQGEPDSPKAPLGNNFRPIQSLNHRFIRTNIDFRRTNANAECPTMKRNMHYQVNAKHLRT